jgi:far upstream element-binding protein
MLRMACPSFRDSPFTNASPEQRGAGAQSQPQQPQGPPPPSAQLYQPPPAPHAGAAPGYNPLPQPTSSGSVDISNIKPVNTGSVSFNDAIAKARGIAAEKGVSYDSGRSSAGGSRDPRLNRGAYRRSRSRSRSPPRQQYRDAYNSNPYRDERRADRGRDDGYARRSPARTRDDYSARNDRGRSRSPDTNSELIVIDAALVGLVIGKNGENLRRVEADTGTRIQFTTGPDSGVRERQCRVSGPPRGRMDAIREINRIIDENGGNPVKQMSQNNQFAQRPKDGSNHPALREGENSIQIMVPDKTVGLIIGRGGETIRDLQEKSGCHINIVGENKSINGLRPVNLIGSKSAADHAKRLIDEIVSSDTRGGNSGNGGNGMAMSQPSGRAPDFYQGAVGGSSGGGGGGDRISEDIHVPSEAVGMIIGKGGETIKDMQNQTGCKINVTQPKNPDIEREIGLIGTRHAIEAAKRVIWEKVESVRHRDAGRGGGGGGGRGRDSSDHYGGQPQYSQAQQTPYGQQPAAQPPAPQATPQTGAQPDGIAADPYASWGGYNNYVALWYSAMAAQQGQQGGQAPPGGASGAPGAPGS